MIYDTKCALSHLQILVMAPETLQLMEILEIQNIEYLVKKNITFP